MSCDTPLVKCWKKTYSGIFTERCEQANLWEARTRCNFRRVFFSFPCGLQHWPSLLHSCIVSLSPASVCLAPKMPCHWLPHSNWLTYSSKFYLWMCLIISSFKSSEGTIYLILIKNSILNTISHLSFLQTRHCEVHCTDEKINSEVKKLAPGSQSKYILKLFINLKSMQVFSWPLLAMPERNWGINVTSYRQNRKITGFRIRQTWV